ncbi:SUKH-3 domain-containing protein [Streptomyces cavernicola]|uniref:SUKH-3 domain-containing protein n=1 Tax=Streptomyces cavernicola TaxID=3043613 RepID=A0ABT6SBP5_9ACTN|nr:SUKH-3 domain-containing protein [Streptomyces sp. B-S-A6]MDI3405067.1 SUKH-3 domain-containing protein [Streptomyces sp. B-S-A6]
MVAGQRGVLDLHFETLLPVQDTDQQLLIFRAANDEMHAAADAFLQEFGGLTVNIAGPGVDRAREPFALDPELALGEGDRFAEWGDLLGRRLFPVGELDHGRYFLGVDERRELYLVETWLAGFGSLPEALDNLILGVAPHRIG